MIIFSKVKDIVLDALSKYNSEIINYITVKLGKKADEGHTHNYAPISHASSNDIYGLATESEYGHVMISDTCESNTENDSITAASRRALLDVRTEIMGETGYVDFKEGYYGSYNGSALTVIQPETIVETLNNYDNILGSMITLGVKTPNALTISLNGTSQGSYDGSSAKTINITPSSIGAASSFHIHTISDITSLQSTLDSKASSSHIHTISDITSLQSTLDSKASSSHIHTISDITSLQSTLNSKSDSNHTHHTLYHQPTDSLATYKVDLRAGWFGPDTDYGLSCGESGTHRWTTVYAQSGTVQTSDRNLKQNISELSEKYERLFMLLMPVSYLYTQGTSGRTHVGFISQDVETAMTQVGLTDLDFAGFCKDVVTETIIDCNGEENNISKLDEDGNPIYIYSLRYEEFIALNTHMIQKLYSELSIIKEHLQID